MDRKQNTVFRCTPRMLMIVVITYTALCLACFLYITLFRERVYFLILPFKNVLICYHMLIVFSGCFIELRSFYPNHLIIRIASQFFFQRQSPVVTNHDGRRRRDGSNGNGVILYTTSAIMSVATEGT